MMQKSAALLVKILFVIYICLVMFFCFYTFSSSIVDLSKYFLRIRLDKYVHFLMFFPYPFIAWLTVKSSRHLQKVERNATLIAFFSGVLFALTTELVQKFLLTSREGDPYDFVADFIAITIGALIIHFIGNWMISIFDRLFINKK